MAKNKTDNLLVRTDATRQQSFLSVVAGPKFNFIGPGKYCNIFDHFQRVLNMISITRLKPSNDYPMF